jgi:predicted MFS family arabinose efflux permease
VAALVAVVSARQPVALVLLFVAGWALVTAFSTLNSLVQEQAPDAFRGRILSIYGFAFRGGMPLGSLVAGAAVRSLGVGPVIGALSAALVVLAAVLYARSARLRAV